MLVSRLVLFERALLARLRATLLRRAAHRSDAFAVLAEEVFTRSGTDLAALSADLAICGVALI